MYVSVHCVFFIRIFISYENSTKRTKNYTHSNIQIVWKTKDIRTYKIEREREMGAIERDGS